MKGKNNPFLLDTKGFCYLCLQDACSSETSKTYSYRTLSRYLNLNNEKVYSCSVTTSRYANVLQRTEFMVSLCPACFSLANAFTGMYEELEVIKMKILRSLQAIHEVMSRASQETSRVEKFKERMITPNPVDILQIGILENLRKETIDQCQSKIGTLLTGVPKVVVSPVQVRPDESDSLASTSSLKSPQQNFDLSSSESESHSPRVKIDIDRADEDVGTYKTTDADSSPDGSFTSTDDRLFDRIFVCKYCSTTFQDQLSLRLHIVDRHCDKLFAAFNHLGFSEDVFSSDVKLALKIVSGLDEHRSSCHNWTCNICAKQLTHRNSDSHSIILKAHRHLIDKHFNDVRKQLALTAGFSKTLPSQLKSTCLQISDDHKQSQMEPDPGLKCDKCGAEFKLKYYLRRHKLKDCDKADDKRKSNTGESSASNSDDEEDEVPNATRTSGEILSPETLSPPQPTDTSTPQPLASECVGCGRKFKNSACFIKHQKYRCKAPNNLEKDEAPNRRNSSAMILRNRHDKSPPRTRMRQCSSSDDEPLLARIRRKRGRISRTEKSKLAATIDATNEYFEETPFLHSSTTESPQSEEDPLSVSMTDMSADYQYEYISRLPSETSLSEEKPDVINVKVEGSVTMELDFCEDFDVTRSELTVATIKDEIDSKENIVIDLNHYSPSSSNVGCESELQSEIAMVCSGGGETEHELKIISSTEAGDKSGTINLVLQNEV